MTDPQNHLNTPLESSPSGHTPSHPNSRSCVPQRPAADCAIEPPAEVDKGRDALDWNTPENTACGARQAVAPDAFGDPFSLHDLPLPRPADGYAVQKLGTDTLLDRHQQRFLTVRDRELHALFEHFADAAAAAHAWLVAQPAGTEEYPLAIVPAAYDADLERHILIYGVLPATP